MSFKNLLIIMLFPLLLTGCAASFTYNHLDWIIPWYVDDYVDLTRDQKKSLREELDPFLVWHREEELVRYVDILNGVESSLNGPVTAEEVNTWLQEIANAAERMEYSMLQLGLEFEDQLSDAQMQEFIDNLWERQRDFEQEFLNRTDQEYIEDNSEHMASFLKKIIGRLSLDQKDRLHLAAADLCRFDQPWLTDSENWLNELQRLFQREAGWQANIEASFLARKSRRSPEFQVCLDRNYGVISTAVADVLNQASNKQEEHLLKEIEKLRDRLVKLIAAEAER